MVSALLAMLTWTTPGQTPLGRKSGFSQHWFLCAGFLLVKDISLSMDCYAAMGPSVLQSSTCRAYIWNESKLPKILVTAFFDHSFSHNFSHVISVGRYLRWWKVCRKSWISGHILVKPSSCEGFGETAVQGWLLNGLWDTTGSKISPSAFATTEGLTEDITFPCRSGLAFGMEDWVCVAKSW